MKSAHFRISPRQSDTKPVQQQISLRKASTLLQLAA